MLGVDHRLFKKDRVVVKGRLCLRPGHGEFRAQLLLVFHPADTASTPSGSSFQHNRIAILIGKINSLFDPGITGREIICTGHHRNASVLHDLPGRYLIAQSLDNLRRRSDKDDAIIFTGLGEIRVFRQESVPRMNGICPNLSGNPDDLVDVQVIAAGAIPKPDSLIRRANMQGIFVRRFINSHGGMPKLLHRPNDPQGDFTSIGY